MAVVNAFARDGGNVSLPTHLSSCKLKRSTGSCDLKSGTGSCDLKSGTGSCDLKSGTGSCDLKSGTGSCDLKSRMLFALTNCWYMYFINNPFNICCRQRPQTGRETGEGGGGLRNSLNLSEKRMWLGNQTDARDLHHWTDI